jgi:hypothetical protein
MLFRLLLLLLLAAPAAPAAAYSVLTHQAIVDTTWADCMAPRLQHQYPGGTPVEMNVAKSYAYGGAILQDMGYYPLGSTLFTNLTHYVRAGDFVRNLLRQARNRNEYAFALGALAHYAADNTGHPEGTNVIIPTVYPDLKAKFGPVVTYEQSRVRHTEMEFSFDVVQVAAGSSWFTAKRNMATLASTLKKICFISMPYVCRKARSITGLLTRKPIDL